MIEEKALTKLYYSIGEVAKMFDVNTSNIRFWEKQFPQLSPKKNKNGKRMFCPKDILLLKDIYELTHKEGYTIEGAIKALKNKNTKPKPKEDSVNEAIINRLEAIKQKLIAAKTL